MENFENDIQEQKSNFKSLEDKIKAVISGCSSKTLKRVDENIDGVRNSNRGEQHILENGLSVYIFYKDDQPINYWVSSSPLYEEYEFTNHFGVHKGFKYSGGAGIEYTSGGRDNSLVFNATNYYNGKQLGIIGNQYGRLTKLADTVPTMSGGYSLEFSTASPLVADMFNVSNYHDLGKYEDKCDLENYLKSFQPKSDNSKTIVSDLQDCLSKVSEIVKSKEQSYDKKGFLKKLLSKNKSLDAEINSFEAFGKGSK